MGTYQNIREYYEKLSDLGKRHNLKRGVQTNVNAQIDEIVGLLDELNSKGLELIFDNTTPNHYKLIDTSGNEFEFSLYKDVKNCLLLLVHNI